MRKHLSLMLALLALGFMNQPAEAGNGHGKGGVGRGKQEASPGKERKKSKKGKGTERARTENTQTGSGCGYTNACSGKEVVADVHPETDEDVRFECKEREEIKGGKYALHLRAFVELALPNDECKVFDVEDAESADVTVIFVRNGEAFAICHLDLIGIHEDWHGDLLAKYGLDLYGPGRKRGKKFRQLGYCDVDPHSEAVTKMYPDIGPGDEALLYVNGVRTLSGLLVE